MTAAPVHVALHAALDPRAAGGVQTNLLALVRSLQRFRSECRIELLMPESIEEAWRQCVQGASPQVWPHQVTWYREAARKGCLQTLADLRGRVQSGKRQRDRHLGELGVEVLHFPYQLAFDTRLPTIYEPWDLQHIHLPHLFSEGERAWRTAMYKRACDRARFVVTATATTKRDLVAQFAIAPEKIAVVYRESKLAPAPPEDEQQRILAERGLTAPFAFFPAMTYAHKNHVRLFEALALLRDQQGVKIPVVCSGRRHQPHWPAVEASLAKLELEGQVTFLGTLTEQELTTLYSKATLMVFPSLFEGLGLPLLEAMQFDLAIVASKTSCIPEVTRDAALLFDPHSPREIADSLHRLWIDPGLRTTLARNGRKRRLAFSSSAAAQTFLALYRTAAGRHLPRRDAERLEEALAR